MMMIQKDPELWDLIEKIKDQDATLEFFLDDVACLLYTSDAADE